MNRCDQRVNIGVIIVQDIVSMPRSISWLTESCPRSKVDKRAPPLFPLYTCKTSQRLSVVPTNVSAQPNETWSSHLCLVRMCMKSQERGTETPRSSILEGSWKKEKEVINVPFGANQLGWLAKAYTPLESKKWADRCETAELGEQLEHRVSALSPPLSFWNRSQAFWFVLLEGEEGD